MWCRRVRNHLSAYADGELGGAERCQVEAHLAECADCAREYASLQKLVRLTTAIPMEETPSSLHSRIMAQLGADSPGGRAHPRPAFPMRLGVFNPWMWAAAGGAAAALIMGLFPRSPGSPEPHQSPLRTQPKSRAEAPRDRRAPHPQAARHGAPTRPDVTPARDIPEPEAGRAERRLAAAASRAATQAAGAEQSLPVQEVRKPAAERPERPQPVDPIIPSKLAVEPKSLEPPAPAPVSTQGKMASIPENPEMETTAGGLEMPEIEIAPAVMEKDGSTRMAGTPAVGEMPAEDDEGLRSLRMFLEERNRTVPQPPLVRPTRMRKL